VAEGHKPELIPFHVELVDHSVIPCTQAKLRPTLKSVMQVALQPTPQIAYLDLDVVAHPLWQSEEPSVELP